MGITIKTKVKLRINGKEYGSLDEAPPEVREAYEKGLHLRTGTAININGQSYASVDDMPAELRQRYEEIMALARENSGARESGPGTTLRIGVSSDAGPAMEETSSSRTFIIVAVVLVILGLLYWGLRPG